MPKLNVMPKWNELFLPVMYFYSDGVPHSNRLAKIEIADTLNLNDDLRKEVNDKQRGNKIEGRVGWALSALKIAGLLAQYERGSFVITEDGKKLLEDLPEVLDEKFLEKNYPTYRENKIRNSLNCKNKLRTKGETENNAKVEDYTPKERIENAIGELNEHLSTELLDKLYGIDPYSFEKIVADLLAKMGYGDSIVTQKAWDGGIDAIVNEDKLGLDKIFVQAKRYAKNNTVTEKQVRDFLGALSAHKVQKGVFVTTSSFDKKARVAAQNSDKKIRLIEGDELAELMIEYGIGTATLRSYEIKIFDADYFDNL